MTIQSIATNQMSPAMQRLASGNRINSAADDAAGLAIVESMTAQIRGLDQGTRNTMDMQALTMTAEGGMSNVSDSVQRIRELSVQAANGTLSDSNRAMIQEEIDQLASGIQASVNNVEFNSMRLLDGSAQGLNTASSADGTGATVNINDMSGIARAITDFNVTGEFNINDLDSVLGEVSSSRAELGAYMNRFDYTASANTISSLNLSDSRSRIRDADMAVEMAAFTQDRVINEMQLLMQQQQQRQIEEEGNSVFAASVAR